MDRVICAECRVEMEKPKSGLVLETEDHALHKADYYRCPSCGIEVYSMCERAFCEGAFREDYDTITDVEIILRGEPSYPE